MSEPGLDRYRGPEYQRLLAAARKSLERTGGQLTGRVSVAAPDDAERKVIIGITGVHQPAGTKRMTVRLTDLDAALNRATGLGGDVPGGTEAEQFGGEVLVARISGVGVDELLAVPEDKQGR